MEDQRRLALDFLDAQELVSYTFLASFRALAVRISKALALGKREHRRRSLMIKRSCAAIDLGASSGRVAVVECDGERLSLREARRFDTPQRRDPETGYQAWDLDGIEREIRAGLTAATGLAPLESVGVDGWGVDYVLLDADRRRIGPAIAYRDDRTRGVMQQVFARMSAEEVYRRTGIQFQPFNTLYQLAAAARQQPAWLARARHLLMLPDFFHFRLGGTIATEYTNATTTQLYGIATDAWDEDLLALAGISRELLSAPVKPGTCLGETSGLTGKTLKVIAPGTHDTASAVAAIPLSSEQEAFISSGTWSLMGVESQRPVVNERARRLNFTNEGGVERRYRILKNIAGLWLTQCIGRELGKSDVSLLAAAADAAPWCSSIDPDDARFLNPPSMIEAIRSFCAETGQPEPADAGALVRCALESLALSYRRVKDELESLLGLRLTRIHIGGGGGQNGLLNQLAADACEVPVLVGPAESSLLGNGCVQLIALGALSSLEEARAFVRRSCTAPELQPRSPIPQHVRHRFQTFTRPSARESPPS
jgi:rhamnulokinase